MLTCMITYPGLLDRYTGTIAYNLQTKQTNYFCEDFSFGFMHVLIQSSFKVLHETEIY